MKAPLVRRSVGMLFLSFVNSAFMNVVPQGLFARTGGEARHEWLAATLLVGTFGAMGGVALARRWGFGPRPVAGGLAAVALVALAAGLGLSPQLPLMLLALHVATRFASNFAMQEVDRRAVALVAGPERALNDRLSTGFRFLGMLLGPLWFAFFPGPGGPTALVLGGLTLLLAATVHAVAPAPPPARAERRPAPLSPEERALVFGSTGVYAAYCLLASNITAVMSEVQHVPEPGRRAGVLVTTVYAAALLTAVGMRRASTARMLVAPALMAATGLLLWHPLGASLPAGLAFSAGLGVGFGLFLLSLRDRVSRAAKAGREGLLAVYNDLGNTSALAAFVLMALLLGLRRLTGLPFDVLLSAGLVLASAAGALGLSLSRRRAAGAEPAVEPAP